MDPLQRLAENNLKGLNVKKTEGNFRYFLLSAIFLLLYAGASYLYFTYEESILGFEFWGPSKQVWLIVVLLTGGIGSLFFSGGLAIVIWADLFAKELGTKVKNGYTFIFAALSIGVSLSFIFLSITLSIFVIDNNQNIFHFLSFGYREPPYFIEMILNYLLVIIVSITVGLFYSIFTLPFKASRHAKEFASTTRTKAG
ncbi:hypothetical protein [Colwellia polaris]|jgi:hypothetical protein|uniref:hypothetical protein n=1 Tax=Colwellia polaris TaxID=326537 RepID=UPI000A16EF8C|nr:hypothetical protein [Colwellia polaris]